MDSDIHIELVPTADGLALWPALQARVGEVPLSASEVWNRTWLEAFGGVVPNRCAVGRSRGEVVGLCLVTEGVDQKEGPLPLQTLHLGTAGESPEESVCVEYNTPLADPAQQDAFVCALLTRLEAEEGWDAVRLDGVSAALATAVQSARDRVSTRWRASPYFDLERVRRGSEPLEACLGRSTRKNLRRNRAAAGALSVEWSHSEESAQAMLDELIRLHQLRWQALGEPGAFSNVRFESFHRQLVSRLVPTGRAALVRVSGDEGLIGCVYLLIDRHRALFYQSGWVRQPRRSPGLLVDFLCMEACLERGFTACDFLVGDSRHKRSLSNAEERLAWIRLDRAGSFKLAALGALRRIKRVLDVRDG